MSARAAIAAATRTRRVVPWARARSSFLRGRPPRADPATRVSAEPDQRPGEAPGWRVVEVGRRGQRRCSRRGGTSARSAAGAAAGSCGRRRCGSAGRARPGGRPRRARRELVGHGHVRAGVGADLVDLVAGVEHGPERAGQLALGERSAPASSSASADERLLRRRPTRASRRRGRGSRRTRGPAPPRRGAAAARRGRRAAVSMRWCSRSRRPAGGRQVDDDAAEHDGDDRGTR